MVKPIKFKDIKSKGWYFHIDFNSQKNRKLIPWGKKPYGGWFYEKCEDCWRSESGHSVTGEQPDYFKEDDLFIGPIDSAIFYKDDLVFNKFKSIILETAQNIPTEINFSTRIGDLGLDSLDVLETVMCIEEEFDVDIDDDEVNKIKTVEDFYVLLKDKL